MVKLLIIADDFTGALDTGIQFAKHGISTQVFTKYKLEDQDIKQETEVLVVDTESRPMSQKEAYKIVNEITQWAIKKGISIILKKTDSALRGNIGAELQGVVDACDKSPLFFLPSHPKIQRITRNGVHYISGELLEKSVFGQDPFEPVTKSYIPDIIRQQSSVPVACIGARESIPSYMMKERKIIVCDIEKIEDFDSRLEEVIHNNGMVLFAGCAALGEQLVEKIPFHLISRKTFHQTEELYMACGSLNSITCKQIEYAEKNGGFTRRHLTSEQKLNLDYYKTKGGKDFVDDIIKLCVEKKKLIIDTIDVAEEKYNFIKGNKISKKQMRTLIPKTHGVIMRELMEHKLDVTCFITGGDTLMGYMRLIGCTQVEPICEIEQGAVVSLLTWNGHCQQIVSKSGGFGTEDILCRIAEKIIKK